MILDKFPAVKALSLEEKQRLAEEIWEEISQVKDPFPVSQEHLDILHRRQKEHEKHPERVKTWNEVRQNIRQRFSDSPKNEHG